MTITTKQIEDWKCQLTEGNIKQVFDEILKEKDHVDEIENTLRVLKTRHSKLEKTARAGAISKQDEGIERNSIHLSLFEILDAIELAIVTHSEPVEVNIGKEDIEEDANKNVDISNDTNKRPIPWVLIGLVSLLLCFGVYNYLDKSSTEPTKSPKNILIQLGWPTNLPIVDGGKLEMSVGTLRLPLQTLRPTHQYSFGPIAPSSFKDSIHFRMLDIPFECHIVEPNALFAKNLDHINLKVEVPLKTYTGQVLDTRSKPGVQVVLIFEGGVARTSTDANGKYSVQLPNMLQKTVHLLVKKNNRILINRRVGQDTMVLQKIKINDL